MFSDNVEALEAVEDVFWIYKTKLDFKAESGDSVFFVAEGIDYIFDIILDGKKLHSQGECIPKSSLTLPKSKAGLRTQRIDPSSSQALRIS